MIVAVPFAEHAAAAVDTVGVDGTVNCAAILNDELAIEVHDPFDVVTV